VTKRVFFCSIGMKRNTQQRIRTAIYCTVYMSFRSCFLIHAGPWCHGMKYEDFGVDATILVGQHQRCRSDNSYAYGHTYSCQAEIAMCHSPHQFRWSNNFIIIVIARTTAKSSSWKSHSFCLLRNKENVFSFKCQLKPGQAGLVTRCIVRVPGE